MDLLYLIRAYAMSVSEHVATPLIALSHRHTSPSGCGLSLGSEDLSAFPVNQQMFKQVEAEPTFPRLTSQREGVT